MNVNNLFMNCLTMEKVRVEVGPGTNLDALIRDMSDKGLLTESASGKRLPICMKPEGCKTR